MQEAPGEERDKTGGEGGLDEIIYNSAFVICHGKRRALNGPAAEGFKKEGGETPIREVEKP